MVRHVPSEGAGYSDLDIQNITMTLDYCFQALRVRPSRTIVLNCGQDAQLPKPLTLFTPEGIIPVSHELQQEYLPNLAVIAFMAKSKKDLRPKNYLIALNHQNLLRKGAWAFLAGALVVFLLALNLIFSILSLRSELDTARQRESTIPEYLASYHDVKQERVIAEPLITAMNTQLSTPTLPELLANLPDFPGNAVSIDSLTVKKTDDATSLHLSGTFTEKTYAALQSRFEDLLGRLSQLKELTAASQQLDQKSQVFTIEMKSKP